MRGETGARDLAIAVGVIVAIARFSPEDFVWPIAVALFAAVVVGALQVVAESHPGAENVGIPIESVILPGAAAVAALGGMRLVPVGIVLAPAVVLAGGLVGLALVTELRIARSSGPPSSSDRTAVLVQVLIIGFLGFAGTGALIPGGLPAPGEPTTPGDAVAVLAQTLADGTFAFVLAYRVAALRSSSLRDVAWFSLTSAIVVAIAAVALRSIEIPRVLGPALLVLVFFLWDAIHAGGAPRRRDPRRVWEAALLAVLAVVVIGWSLGIRA